MLDFGYYNMDCMKGMKEFPDKYFDLAVVDPPYGGGGKQNKGKNISAYRTGGQWASRYKTQIAEWDYPPDAEYFKELFHVSKNQIIWGGNYFSLPPTRCFLVWHKKQIGEDFTMSMVEYAWTSLNENAKLFSCVSNESDGKRFHPTQKPIELYAWIFNRYAKPGDKILDTHVGSASSLMAAYDCGLPFVGFEIDEYYYKLSKQRLDEHMAQHNLFCDFPEILGGIDEQ